MISSRKSGYCRQVDFYSAISAFAEAWIQRNKTAPLATHLGGHRQIAVGNQGNHPQITTSFVTLTQSGEGLLASMARPKRNRLDEIRTRAWSAATVRQSGLTIPNIEEHLEDTSKAWYKYRKGEHVPNAGIVERVERIWPGTAHFFHNGPASLFAAATAMSLADAYWIFKPSKLEGRYHSILPRFLEATHFVGSPAQGLVALAEWLCKIAESECWVLPIAVSANLIVYKLTDSGRLWEIILPSVAVFEQEYDFKAEDLLRTDHDLLVAFVEQSRLLGRTIPQWVRNDDVLALREGAGALPKK